MEIRVGGKFRLIQKINKGCYSEIWKAMNIEDKDLVAVKIEKNKCNQHDIHREARVYEVLGGGHGISDLHWSGLENDESVIVLDLLGPSLESLVRQYKTLPLLTVLKLGMGLLDQISYIHSKNIIHRDLKPDDILLENKHSDKVYIIDFGLARSYKDHSQEHIAYAEGKKFVGTARYASVNSHLGIQLSRRDDLEMLGYLLIYLVKGQLPWQSIRAYTKKEKYDKITEKKLSTMINILCQGIPSEFSRYMEYVRSLRFEERPEYMHLKYLFRDLYRRMDSRGKHVYQWMLADEESSEEEESKHEEKEEKDESGEKEEKESDKD